MDQEIKIIAEVKGEDTCLFTVDRPLYPGNSFYFSTKEDAKGSPLVEAIFAIDNVASVLVYNNLVRVRKIGNEDWMDLAKKIGMAIRKQIQSGIKLFSDELESKFVSENNLKEKVSKLLENQINPSIAYHGGFIELVDVKGNVVLVRMGGGCQGCGLANLTLKQGIERIIKQYIPEVGEILDVTDHTSGRNPYFTPSIKDSKNV